MRLGIQFWSSRAAKSRGARTRLGPLSEHLAIAGLVLGIGACGGAKRSADHDASQTATVEEAAGPVVNEGTFVTDDGLHLFYRKVGVGPEVAVFLHGGPLSLSDGGYDLDPLAKGRSLLMFEQRSGARSEMVKDPAFRTYEHYVRDVEAFRKHFGLERMAIMGNSWGAILGVLYANEHPEHVSRLLLLSPGPIAASFRPDRVKKIDAAQTPAESARMDQLWGAVENASSDEQLQALCEEIHHLMFRHYLNDPTILDRKKVKMCADTAAGIRYEMGSPGPVWKSLGEYDLRPMLAKINVPVLVIEGKDSIVPMDSTNAYATSAPDGKLLLIPNSGHAVFLEGGDVYFHAADQFLRGTWPNEAARPRQP